MCLYPTLIKNKKYQQGTKANIKRGYVPKCTDLRTLYVPIGCQNCIECRKQKSRSWQTRLLEDIKTNKNAHFVTLTFSNQNYAKLYEEIDTNIEGYERDNAIATLATRRFLERWRKKYKRSLRHWAVTELGHNGTENIHIHALVWTANPEEINTIWSYGYTWIGQYVNQKTINYIIKYITKKDEKHKTYQSKILTSPGIGSQYTNTNNAKRNRFNGKTTKEHYKTSTGHKISLPIYWRNKIYSEQERQQLWIQKLDKRERWILGQKIDISKTYETYDRELKWAREKNKQLGYGTNERNWNKEVYERERRKLTQIRRLMDA